MEKSKRRSEKEEFWRLVLQEQQESGLSIRAFCRRENLSERSFFAWRKRSAQRDSRVVGPKRSMPQPCSSQLLATPRKHHSALNDHPCGCQEIKHTRNQTYKDLVFCFLRKSGFNDGKLVVPTLPRLYNQETYTMINYQSVRTYRDLLDALHKAIDEQLDMPIQCADSHPVDEHVYELKQAICLGTVDELDLRYARSVKDNRRSGEEMVLFCDGNCYRPNCGRIFGGIVTVEI